ncbi:uncharacterized protein LOC144439642 [Glandiceps talaboti]
MNRLILIAIVLTVVAGAVKGRVCPKLEKEEFGICEEECEVDMDCLVWGQLCCSNGCGHTCVTGVFEDRGKCPETEGVGHCEEECESDDDCYDDQKCCSNGCGHTCITTVFSFGL